VETGLVPELPELKSRQVVVLCGDISLRKKFFVDSPPIANGLTVIRCPEAADNAISLLPRVNASLLLVRQGFIEQLPEAWVLQISSLGNGCRVIAVLESQTVEASSATKMLRLGCRGVLPQRFSSKMFRRAVFSVLSGELWAPARLVSELLSELLRATLLKTEGGLTPQEVRIRELNLQGYTNSAIAETLFISLETVRWHKRRINRKLRERIQPRPPQTNLVPPKAAAG
jgi:DNA-binding NarL/FixJ family response regulator